MHYFPPFATKAFFYVRCLMCLAAPYSCTIQLVYYSVSAGVAQFQQDLLGQLMKLGDSMKSSPDQQLLVSSRASACSYAEMREVSPLQAECLAPLARNTQEHSLVGSSIWSQKDSGVWNQINLCFNPEPATFYLVLAPSQKIQTEFKDPGEFNVVDSAFSFEYCSFFSNGKNEQPINLILKRFFIWRFYTTFFVETSTAHGNVFLTSFVCSFDLTWFCLVLIFAFALLSVTGIQQLLIYITIF